MKYLLFIFLLSSQYIFSQVWQLQSSVPLEADKFIGVDSYEYTYWVKDGVLNKKGKGVNFTYSDKLLGSIQSIDIINPLTVMVFYQQSQTLVILDNKLNELDRVVFTNISDFIEVSRIGNAGNRRLWIVNSATQRLEILDYRSKQVEAFSQSFTGEVLDFFSDYNNCYIKTSDAIYVYNIYGSLLQTLSISEYGRFFSANKGLVVEKKDKWYYWNINKEEYMSLIDLKIEESKLKDLFYTRQVYYVFDGTHLHTYIAEK